MSVVRIKQFGSKGKDHGQFRYPTGICYDSKHQHILVSEEHNHRIQIFNNNGDYLSSFGSQGSKDGQFNFPNQISIHPLTNNIFVADSLNHRIQIFDDEGTFLASFDKGLLQNPCAVSCNQHSPDHIVTADYAKQIHLFTPSFFCSSSQPYQLLRSFCSTGVRDNCREDQTDGVAAICFDDERKKILICDYNNKRLSVWSSNGSQFIKTISMINKQSPNSVCMDYSSSTDNNNTNNNYNNNNSHYFMVGTQTEILVYDTRKDDQVIQTMRSDSKGFEKFGTGIYGLCIRNDDGVLMATDRNNHRVQMFANQRRKLMNTLLMMGSQHSSSSKRQRIATNDSFFFMNNQLYDYHLMGVIAEYLPFYYS